MRGRNFWRNQGPDAQGGLGRCQAHSGGRGMGVAGRRQTCFPTEGFVILGLHPRQELGSGSESLRAGHIAWSPLCPQSGETEIHLRPGDRHWWWKAQRWPAWWGRSGAAAAAPHPGGEVAPCLAGVVPRPWHSSRGASRAPGM